MTNGYIIAFSISSVLTYLTKRPYTDTESGTCHHISSIHLFLIFPMMIACYNSKCDWGDYDLMNFVNNCHDQMVHFMDIDADDI